MVTISQVVSISQVAQKKMPGKVWKRALHHRCRQAGLSTSVNREDLLNRLDSVDFNDKEYVSAENLTLQNRIRELERTVQELRERTFHPPEISSPIATTGAHDNIRPNNLGIDSEARTTKTNLISLHGTRYNERGASSRQQVNSSQSRDTTYNDQGVYVSCNTLNWLQRVQV